MADFNDPADAKVVTLDRECREQQVAEGWFPDLDSVPPRAITLTIPALFRIPELILSIPGERKAAIVARTLTEEISTRCPATILAAPRRPPVSGRAVSEAPALNLCYDGRRIPACKSFSLC